MLEEALYDIQSMRMFAGLELGCDAIPETTILNFRHLLERYDLTKAIFAAVAEHLAAKGELLRGGTIVDATLIAASPSTKNQEQRRDPEMTSSKKGNQWYFGMKAHIGVDAESGLVHTAGVTTGKVHDAKVMVNLIREDDRAVYGDKGYASDEEARGGRRRRAVGRGGKSEAGPRSHEAAARSQPPLRQSAREGRTRVSRRQMPVRLSQGPLSRGSPKTVHRCSRSSRSPISISRAADLRPLEGKCGLNRAISTSGSRSNS